MPISFDDVCEYILNQNSSPKLRYLQDYLALNLNARFPQQRDPIDTPPIERLKALDKEAIKSVKVEVTFSAEKFLANELPYINATFYDQTGTVIQWNDLINKDLETLTALEACLAAIYTDHIRPLVVRQHAIKKQIANEIEALTKGKDDGTKSL